jgi:hypothetical protein
VAHHALFVVDDNIDEPVEMHDAPIPPIGADVEVGGRYYTVEHVVISYSDCPIEADATIWLVQHAELG